MEGFWRVFGGVFERILEGKHLLIYLVDFLIFFPIKFLLSFFGAPGGGDFFLPPPVTLLNLDLIQLMERNSACLDLRLCACAVTQKSYEEIRKSQEDIGKS